MNHVISIVKDFTLEIPVKDIAQSAEWYRRWSWMRMDFSLS